MTDVAESAAPDSDDRGTARSVFLAWEKLRIFYNAALVVAVVLSASSGAESWSDPRFWRFLSLRPCPSPGLRS